MNFLRLFVQKFVTALISGPASLDWKRDDNIFVVKCFLKIFQKQKISEDIFAFKIFFENILQQKYPPSGLARQDCYKLLWISESKHSDRKN